MPAPSQISIATSSLNRLVKEVGSYHKESSQQQARIAKLESGDIGEHEEDNAEFVLKQEVSLSLTCRMEPIDIEANFSVQKRALEETKAMFPQLKIKIEDGQSRLQTQLDSSSDATPEEVTKAKEALAGASTILNEAA
ncbi:hypothetical protein B0A48_15121 [Cryoendolithus antarcticus]|uniref:Tubulin-specific chaperone A n=1 Tax=Cryoendolithus antarcticus TaxID=1507870 RepID=A0A1V8SJF6_9PEZI|nr:hypothetical protein B0A48_15121 [Cryoendolithus antarcticus]